MEPLTEQLILANPEGLWLLAATPLFWLPALRLGGELSRRRRWLLVLTKTALVVALALALADPQRLVTSRQPALGVVADWTASLSTESRQRQLRLLDDLWRARAPGRLVVVAAAEQPRLVAGPGGGSPRRLAELEPARHSDLEAAALLAVATLPAAPRRRLLVMSDGGQTHGDLTALATRLARQGVTVSTLALAPRPAGAWVESLQAPATVAAGEKLEVEVQLYCRAESPAHLQLEIDGRRRQRRRLRCTGQLQQLRLQLQPPAGQSGWRRLTARLHQPGDDVGDDNQAERLVYVLPQPRALVVSARPPARALQQALAGAGLQTEVRAAAAGLPDRARLAEHELVVLDGLELDRLPGAAVERLRWYLVQAGGGLLVGAGQQAAGLAAEQQAPVEQLLPVEFHPVKKKEKIPAAVAFVLDRSSSMARQGKFGLLLRITIDSLARLTPTAQVVVVCFDDFPEVVVPLTEARHRQRIRRALLAQRAGGGTSIYPALQEAHRQLRRSAAPLRHVILLSDGQSISLFAHHGHIVEQLAREGITVSAIALGPDADAEEMKRIAGRGGGRFHAASSLDEVPAIFTAETERFSESPQLELPLRAVPARLGSLLADIDLSSAPQLQGMLAGEARPTSEVLLVGSRQGRPLLARWQYGLGRVLLWASDLHGGWTREWTGWPAYGRFWGRLARAVMRPGPIGGLRLQVRQAGRRARVSVETPGPVAADQPAVQVLEPTGQVRGLALERLSERRSAGWLELDQPGAYGLRATWSWNQVDFSAYASLERRSGDEFTAVRWPGRRLLEAVAEAGRGALVDDPISLLAAGPEATTTLHRPARPQLLVLAMLLLLLEVLLRRL